MFDNRFNLRKLILSLSDLLLLFVALYVGLKIRNLLSGNTFYAFSKHLAIFLIVFIGWLIIFYLFDLYNLKKIKSNSFIITSVIMAVLTSTGLSIIFFYLVPIIISPKTILLIVALVAVLLIIVWRLIWKKVITKNIKPRVAIIGSDEAKIKVLEEILNPSESDYQVVGFISLGQESTLLNHDFRTLGNYNDLENIINQEKIDELIAAFNYYKYPEATAKVALALSLGIKIFEMALFYEEATGKVPVDCIDQIWFLSQLKNNKNGLRFLLRCLDLFFAGLGLLISLPFLPLIFIAIKIDSAGPIFYSQTRTGKNEKDFQTYKFRTMVDKAEEKTGAVWSQQNDWRITKVGKFLRKTRLDELPQLFNVLIGEMSLVGPRPERPEFVSQLKTTIPYYSHRHIVKPGLTGWAQIKYQYANSLEQAMEKLQYDLYYIKNRSLLLYLMIVIRTIRIILTRQGI